MVSANVNRLVAIGLAMALGGAMACATTDASGKPVNYSMTAKQNYDKGLAELKDEDWLEAVKYFAFVKQKFPFSKYAVLSELALADTQFARGGYAEAIDSYKSFERLHPTHEKVEDGYAAFKVTESYVRQMPEDWFIFPPAEEKDQSPTRDALRELDEFLDKFPESPYRKEAQGFRRDVVQRLVDHEVYVARFYRDRGHPKAAMMRLEAVIRRFPGSGREPELLIVLGETQLRMGDPRRARETFERVVAEFGAAYQARRAELYLQFIEQRYHGRYPDVPASPTVEPSVSPNG